MNEQQSISESPVEKSKAEAQVRRPRKADRRRERQQALKQRKWRNYAIAFFVLLLAVFGLYRVIQSTGPQGEDFSRSVPLMVSPHISVGSDLPDYTSNPPTSGPHYAQTARSGFREESLPDQHMVHNLEHGDVWISFHPRIDDAAREELKQFAAPKVIITPREANDTDIALAAWGRLDTFNLEGDPVLVERIRDFIKRHLGKGPEAISGASGGI